MYILLVKKFIYDLLVYLGIIKVKYNISDKIDFGSKKANLFFKNQLLNCKNYFEIGSGNTTLLAKKFKKNFFSVESKKDFYNEIIKKKLQINFYSLGLTKKFSVPYFIKIKKKKISKYINSIYDINFYPDLILIDGRFRVACFFSIIQFLKNKKNSNCKIVFDDFDRVEYKIIRSYFNYRKVGRLAILKLKNQKKKYNLDKILLNYKEDPS